MGAKAFQFHCFENVQKVPMGTATIGRKLFSFYVKSSKPQYESWSLKNIVRLKAGKTVGIDGFTNIYFKVIRGHNHEVLSFLWWVFQ